MNKNIQKMESKKEYTAPQMDVMDFKVQGVLCGSDGVDVIACTEGVDCD